MENQLKLKHAQNVSKNQENQKLESCIYHLVENIRKIAILIKPFMENTSNEILRQLGINDEKYKTWQSIMNLQELKDCKVIEKGEPLFMRLNPEEEIEFIKSKMGA